MKNIKCSEVVLGQVINPFINTCEFTQRLGDYGAQTDF